MAAYSRGEVADTEAFEPAADLLSKVNSSGTYVVAERAKEVHAETSYFAKEGIEFFLRRAVTDSTGQVRAVIRIIDSHPNSHIEVLRETTDVFASRMGLELERLRTSEELHKTQEQLVRAQEAARMGLWSCDIDSSFVFLSDVSMRLIGLSPTDNPILRRDILRYLEPGDRTILTRNIDHLLENHSSDNKYQAEHRIRKPDGQKIWLSVFGVVVSDASGEPRRMVGFLLDATERKKAERHLVESEATLSSILSAAPTGIGMVTGQSLHWVNRHICDMVRRSRSELLAGGIRVLFPTQAEYDRVLDVEGAQIANRGISRVETKFQHANGKGLHIILSSMPIDRGNHERGLICVAQDITELRETEEIAAENRGLFQAIFECANAGLVMVKPDGTVLQANRAYERMLGYERGKLIGMNVCEITHPDDITLTRDQLRGVAGAGGPATVYEKRYLKADGTVLPTSATVSAVRNASGEVEGALGVAIDITAQKDAQEALELALEELEILKEHLEAEDVYLREEITDSRGSDEIIGDDPSMQMVLTRVHQVARTNATVLITGETGTGKELIARAIHWQSKRRRASLIRVNCASIPRDLFESEFFGHDRGSFTGAVANRTGRFELADGGTLLLDEVGEIPLELQSKLLRVLQEGEYERIGDEQSRRSDVRVIAATNRDIEVEVKAGRFREDLFYRLSVFPIELPPLRDRLSDVSALAERFLQQACRRIGVGERQLDSQALMRLRDYDWPGNVRELQNVIERAVIASPPDRLVIPLLGAGEEPRGPRPARAKLHLKHHDDVVSDEDMRQIERQNIVTALRRTDWRVAGADVAAELLGIHPSTLYSRVTALRIERPGNGRGKNGQDKGDAD